MGSKSFLLIGLENLQRNTSRLKSLSSHGICIMVTAGGCTDLAPTRPTGEGDSSSFVIPDLDMVVVFTSWLPESEFVQPELLIRDFIVPAVISPTSLREQQYLTINAGRKE